MACIPPPDPSQNAIIQIASTPIAVRDALRNIMVHPAMMRLSEDARGNADLALAEALNNIVEHAYDSEDGQIELRLRWQPGRLFCDFRDAGLPMPNCTLPKGLAQSVEDDQALPEGGFGWFLIRELTENLMYQRIGACNHLSFQLNVEQ
jgi:serine/threonine-protein kinase RsbW